MIEEFYTCDHCGHRQLGEQYPRGFYSVHFVSDAFDAPQPPEPTFSKDWCSTCVLAEKERATPEARGGV